MPGNLPDVSQRFDADGSGYSATIRGMIKDNQALVASIKDVQRQIKQLGVDLGALPDRKIKVDVDTADAMAKVSALKKELDGLGDRTVHVGGDNGEMVRHLKDISTYMDIATDSMGRMEDHLRLLNRNSADSSASLDQMTQMLRDNADAHNAAAAAVAAHAAANRNAGGGWAAAAAGAAAGGRGGGGGWSAAAAAGAAAGGGGGGGGGGAAAAGGFLGALRPSTIFGGAMPTLQVAHLVTMFTMEVLSTVIPAAVAAGAAGLVGLQAGQNLYQRGTSMWTAAEALGGTYGGQTLGTMVGLTSNLQKAQDLANGGVFGIGGALKDLVGQGGGAFTDQGVQTIAMINRGMAGMVMNNRVKQLTDALSGGTGFLRMFGDIGANLGDTLLNLAPNLPGMGPMLFKGLEGITGAMSAVTGGIPGPLMGGLLAGEAGWRWGKLVLGGGKLPWFLGGKQVGGVAGLAERMGLGTVGDAAAGVDATGLAGFLDAAGGPVTLGAALSAFALTQLAGTMPGATGNRIGALQGGINQSFGAMALTPITKALYQASQMNAWGNQKNLPGGLATSLYSNIPIMETNSQIGRFGPQAGMGPTMAQVVPAFAQQLADLVTAGPSAIKALQGIGIKGATLTQAFEAMSMAMISPQDFKGGQLDARGKQQLQQFAQTYRTASIGGQPGMASGLLMSGAADFVMSSDAVKSILQTNQALDSMTQIMTGGPAGQAALFGMLGGTPVTHTRAGLKVPAGPAFPAMAKALANIFTPQGAAAWNTFAGPQGLMAAQQANLDQARMYMTLGAISGQQGAQLGAFDLQQMLPLAAKSPMAQYMLEQMGMQASIPGISVGMKYKDLVRAITGTAPGAKGALGILTQGTKAVADLPAIAASLITGDMGGPSALQSGLTAQMAQQALALQAHPLLKGGGVNRAALQGLMSSMTAGGVKPGQMTVSVDAVLKNLHVPSDVISKINAAIGQGVNVPVKADTSKIGASLNKLQNKVVTAQVKAEGTSEVRALQAQIDALKSKTVQAAAHAEGAAAVARLNGEIAALHDKIVTVLVRTINQTILQTITAPGGVASATLAGGPAGMRLTAGHAAGYRVPGYGGGDIVPAMLEPGELVVPKHQVAGGLVDHLRGSIPGFAAGGFVGQQAYGPMAYWGGGSQMAMWNPALYAQLLAAMRATQGIGVFDHPQGFRGLLPLPGLGGPGGGGNVTVHPSAPLHHAGSRFAVEVLKGMGDGFKNAKGEAASLAKALVSRLQQEVAYAKGVAGAAAYGQGYDPTGKGSGIFGSMQLNPSGLTQAQMHASPSGNIKDYNAYVAAYAADQVGANAPQSVQDQMKSYLATEKSFSKDIGKLRKGHLNKAVLAQLIAAGPQQGDALAQSILGGQGGAGAVNKLWAQIQKASKGIGAQAAMGKYGGHLSPDLKNATVVGKGGVAVNISVNAGKGGDLELTKEQIAAIVAQVQAALLRQAKKNNKTGIKLPGKGS